MQISAVDPSKDRLAKAVNENIFALGDICLTSLKEEKNCPNLKLLAPYIFKNIMQLANGLKPNHTIPSSLPYISITSLGPKYGIMSINGLVMASPA